VTVHSVETQKRYYKTKTRPQGLLNGCLD